MSLIDPPLPTRVSSETKVDSGLTCFAAMMGHNHTPPTGCDTCGQLFGAHDRYLLPDEVILRCVRYNKNPTTGVRDIPALPECFPCEVRVNIGSSVHCLLLSTCSFYIVHISEFLDYDS